MKEEEKGVLTRARVRVTMRFATPFAYKPQSCKGLWVSQNGRRGVDGVAKCTFASLEEGERGLSGGIRNEGMDDATSHRCGDGLVRIAP